jgi:hypothetical protein
MPIKLGKKMVEANTVVMIAVYMLFPFFSVLGRMDSGVRARPNTLGLSVISRQCRRF